MPLSKKDKEILRGHKANIDVPKGLGSPDTHQQYIVQMSLTKGELMALRNALHNHSSMVVSDVRAFLDNAIERAKIEF